MGSERMRPISLAGGIAVAALALASASPAHAADSFAPGVLIDRVPLIANPEESYALYLPSGYSPDRPAPILYGFDPCARGRVPVERFQAAAERYGWIVVGSNASRNGIAVGDIIGRLWGDTHARIAIDPRRVYTTGFSGGARVASGMGLRSRDQVAGVIAFGAGLPSAVRGCPKTSVSSSLRGPASTTSTCPRCGSSRRTWTALPSRTRLETWDGGHEWAPAELCIAGPGMARARGHAQRPPPEGRSPRRAVGAARREARAAA